MTEGVGGVTGGGRVGRERAGGVWRRYAPCGDWMVGGVGGGWGC